MTFLGPLPDRIRSTAPRSFGMVQPRIGHLFSSRGPSNISGLVISVVIDAIQCQFWRWTKADISEEGRETISPFFTDLNTAGSVVAILAGLWVVTSLAYGTPKAMLWALAHPVRAVVCEIHATAGRGDAGSQTTDKDGARLAANALAGQMPQAVFPWRLSENCPGADACPGRNRAEQVVASDHRGT